MALSIFIGHDSRESVASYVLAHSIKKRTKSNPNIKYLKHNELRKAGDFTRPWLVDGMSGDYIDLVDNRVFGTEYSHTRFLVPHLMKFTGWALFVDADIIFLSDVAKLFAFADDKYAVMCVKHTHIPAHNSAKLNGREQFRYHRKNWSSMVLWNCGHPANACMTKERVSFMRGVELHAFSWLPDNLIGELPYSHNYISGVTPKHSIQNGKPDSIHFTNGGPWQPGCNDVTYAQLWQEEYEDWQNTSHDMCVSPVPTIATEEKKKKRFDFVEYEVPDGVILPEQEIIIGEQ